MAKDSIIRKLWAFLTTAPITYHKGLGYGCELGREVPRSLVASLRESGANVSVYRHKGTVATVVTWQ